jgi:hypothetical protein
MLLMKLLLVPLLIAAVTQAGRRFGPTVAGWFTATPIVAGPIVLFIALEQGASFAALSAQSTLSGVVSLGAFCLVYALCCAHAPWPVALGAGWLAFGLSTLALERLEPPFGMALGLALAVPSGFPALFPKRRWRGALGSPHPLELPTRMLAAAALVTLVTALAQRLGPGLSGLLTPFPIATSVVAVFSHRADGADFAIPLLRALTAGLFGFVAFFMVLAVGLPALGVAVGFSAATAAAIAGQVFALGVTRRFSASM